MLSVHAPAVLRRVCGVLTKDMLQQGGEVRVMRTPKTQTRCDNVQATLGTSSFCCSDLTTAQFNEGCTPPAPTRAGSARYKDKADPHRLPPCIYQAGRPPLARAPARRVAPRSLRRPSFVVRTHAHTCIWMRAPRSVPRMALMLGLHRSDSGGKFVIRMCALPLTVGFIGPAPLGPAAVGPMLMLLLLLLLLSSTSPSVSLATMLACTSPRASRSSCAWRERQPKGRCVCVWYRV